MDETLSILDENDPNYGNIVAFQRERDELIRDYNGQFVAYCEGKRIAIGENREEVYAEARRKAPEGIVLLQEITDEAFPNFKLRTTDYKRISETQ